MIGRREKLRVVFDIGSISGSDVLVLFLRAMNELGLQADFIVQDARVELSELKDRILKKKAWPSGVVSNGLEFRFGVLPALNQCLIVLQELELGAAKDWDKWIAPFLNREGFVQAWVSDIEYDYWQNAKDLLEYESVGRSHAHLPKKANGLPPPLAAVEIDVSKNPGRCEFRDGYVEAVGNVMWLGGLFWGRVRKADKEALLSADWLSINSIGSNIVKLMALGQAFCDSSTADKQLGLRAMLYGNE